MYLEYIDQFQTDPFCDETLEAGEKLTKNIAECRRKKWQEFIESTDMTHSSRKAWKTIRVLGNDYTKPNPRSEVTADQVAHQLLENSRGNPDQHPKRAKLPTTAASYTQEPHGFTHPFSLQELCNAIKAMKNKAAGLDDLLCEQIKQLGPIALDWLLNMFNSCLYTTQTTFPRSGGNPRSSPY